MDFRDSYLKIKVGECAGQEKSGSFGKVIKKKSQEELCKQSEELLENMKKFG